MIPLRGCTCPRCKRTNTAARPIELMERLRNTMARFSARKAARDALLADLINALEVLRRQRAVAVAMEAPADHFAELDAEEAAYYARAFALGAAWARPAATLDLRGWPDHLPPAEAFGS